jgi:hypothetical protein
MFYILKAVAQNDMNSQGSRTERSRFSRQAYKTFVLYSQGSHTKRSTFPIQSHWTIYIHKVVEQGVLHCQCSHIEHSMFSWQSHKVLHSQNSRTERSTFTQKDLDSQGSRTECSRFSMQSFRTFYIFKAFAQNVLKIYKFTCHHLAWNVVVTVYVYEKYMIALYRNSCIIKGRHWHALVLLVLVVCGCQIFKRFGSLTFCR